MSARYEFSDYFRALTNHEPYKFQEGIAQQLLNGKSIVFRAPTGSGKTWTTVAPFLFSRYIGRRMADRLIYALPLRSLASTLHKTVSKGLSRVECVSNNAKERKYPSDQVYCSLQMGGESNDPFFEGDVVFCTIDQLLSGYLMLPLSLPPRLGNLVAGALPGAYIVLDEVHLLESRIALGTVIEFLDRFRGLVQFVLMTATISDGSLQWLANRVGAQIAPIPRDQIRQLPVHEKKQRSWFWNSAELTAAHIQMAHCGRRTLVIVNRVSRAQDLYSELVQLPSLRNTKIACLHSRFFAVDRLWTEGQLEPWFGPKPSEQDVILITTQVVEAGIDISADQILTDLAPMNSLVQRAGRTARYKERCEGTVTVFEVDSMRPYDDEDGEFERTRECLRELPSSGKVIDFEEEEAWIERVHGEREIQDFQRYRNLFQRRQQVEKAIVQHDRGQLPALVRDVDAVNILLSGTPQLVEFSSRRWPALLSVPRSAIWALSDAVEVAPSCVWAAEASDDESGPVRFDWKPVSTKAQLASAWLLAVGAAAGCYSEQSGLKLGRVGKPLAVQYTTSSTPPRYQYFFETWADHVQRVLDQAKAMHGPNEIGSRWLDRSVGLADGEIERFVSIVVALHDVGKLTNDWQDTAWEYETAKTGRARSVPIAHTTTGPDERGPKLPPHAVESAFASSPVIEERGLAAWALATAIARHHSAAAFQAQRFALISSAQQLVQGFLGGNSPQLRAGLSALELDEFKDAIGGALDDDVRCWWPVYAYLVRRLRLADQAGTRTGVEAGGSTK